MSALDSNWEHKHAMEVAKRAILATRRDENVEGFFCCCYFFFWFLNRSSHVNTILLRDDYVFLFLSKEFSSQIFRQPWIKEVTEAFVSLVIVHLIINQSTHSFFFSFNFLQFLNIFSNVLPACKISKLYKINQTKWSILKTIDLFTISRRWGLF